MNHQSLAELLGNYGEFIGAIAVVVTLVYLALQIKENSNTVAGATEMDFARELTAWHGRISADPQLIELYEKGAAGEKMTDAELARYRWVIAELLYLYEGVYRQYKRGLVSNDTLEQLVSTAVGFLQTESLVTWWESRTSALSDEFVAYIDKRRKEDQGKGWRPRSVSE
jgi:hypothetical protein